MTPRSLFEVAIRIFGAICFFTTASQIVQLIVAWIAGYFGMEGMLEDMDFYIAQQLTGSVFFGVLGLVLFCYAPQFAGLVYPEVDHEEEEEDEALRIVAQQGFRPVDVYKVVIVVFALYLLTQSVEPLSYMLIGFFLDGVNPFAEVWDSLITQALVNTSVGLALIFGAGRLANLLAVDPPEKTVAQPPKFSAALVVVVLFLFAVLIAVVRLIMFSRS